MEALNALAEPKRGFFSTLSDRPAFGAFVFAYETGRLASDRNDEKLASSAVLESGKRGVVSRRGSERYRIKFAVLGPSRVSPEGQALCSALIGTFFDLRTLSVDTDSDVNTVELLEPSSQVDPQAMHALSEIGITRSPLYFLHAVVGISTGRVLNQDALVERRNIVIQKGTS